MFEMTYVGPLAAVRKDSHVFTPNVPVLVSEDLAMQFADSPDFEIGDPVDYSDDTTNPTGEEE